MEILIGILGIIALSLYIYQNISEPALRIKNYVWRKFNGNKEEYKSYNELAEVYRVPVSGSAKELETFNDFKTYRDDVFEKGEYNPPTKIYTHTSELEDDNIDVVDIYDHEVAK